MNEAKLLCPLDVDKCGYQIKWFHLGSNQINFSPSRSLTHQEVCWYKVDLKGVKFDKLEIKISKLIQSLYSFKNFLAHKFLLNAASESTQQIEIFNFSREINILFRRSARWIH
mmetsp:Transcript_5224/g.4410  ORF Transcript_5224/g.4410 Transcript_5224/m.4410 type:complete len:113 (+) Transcript_5224:248-586(+)